MSSQPFYSGLKIFFLTTINLLNLIEMYFFKRWLNKLIGLGNSKVLVIDDLYECLSEDKSKELGDTLQR